MDLERIQKCVCLSNATIHLLFHPMMFPTYWLSRGFHRRPFWRIQISKSLLRTVDCLVRLVNIELVTISQYQLTRIFILKLDCLYISCIPPPTRKLDPLESVHFGKPVIGVPFFFDQHLNMRIAEENGFGASVPFESLTLDKLQSAVHRLLEDPRYVE